MEYYSKTDHLSSKNNICFFASYFSGKQLPYYIRVYLKELRKYIRQVVLVAVQDLDEESKAYLKENGITLQLETNEGYDFGAWYKLFQKINVREFDHVFLVNDSCVLFGSLAPFMQWLDKNTANVKGFTYSEAVNPHIQSYFTVLDKKAVELAINYFRQNGIKKEISEVISTYELGLNKYFSDHGLKLAAFVDNGGYTGEFSPYYKCVDHHLKQGIPLIKKKILFASYRKDELSNLARMGLNIHPDHYYDLMKQKEDLVIDLDLLKMENAPQMNSSEIILFDLKKIAIKVFRPFYKAFKK